LTGTFPIVLLRATETTNALILNDGVVARCITKAKFHYASWFGASSEQAPNQLRSVRRASSEPASVMEFGVYRASTSK